jgi:hypothetical protein
MERLYRSKFRRGISLVNQLLVFILGHLKVLEIEEGIHLGEGMTDLDPDRGLIEEDPEGNNK